MASDTEADRNESNENVAHDDFDPGTIYAEYTGENAKPLEMSQLLNEAKSFGDSHRHLINKFMTEPSMKTRKMNLIFAKHVSTIKFQKHPEAVMKIKSTWELGRVLSRALVKTMNNEKGINAEKGFHPWRFVILSDEKSPTEYVTITGNLQNSTIISDASTITKMERALFLAVLEEMVKGDGTIPINSIHNLARQEAFKMPATKCDQFLNRMCRQKYFKAVDDDIEITPRILVEMEPWLRAKMLTELRICEFCQNIISRPIFTAECEKCKAAMHFNCFRNATLISKQDHVQCNGCRENITLDQVQAQVEARKNGRVGSKQQKKAVSRNSSDSNDDYVTRDFKSEDSE